MKEINGDLIALAKRGEFDVIIHGCNCFNTMGAGIALQIKRHFPQAYRKDQETRPGDKSKLGQYTCAEFVRTDGSTLTIINAYTQYKYGGKKDHADYGSIETAFRTIKSDFSGRRIGYPKIGAGLAGGDWPKIKEVISRALEDENHTVVHYAPGHDG